MSDRPPIPMSLANQPVQGGIAQPWGNARLADGGVDFRSPHRTRTELAWRRCLCQSCGSPARPMAVLVCGPRQILSGHFDEPPVCPPCALYVSRACPMVSGQVATYPERPLLTEGKRGEKCYIEGCKCGGWTNIDPKHSASMGGQPNLSWYAAWIRPLAYTVTAHKAMVRCSDLGCQHERLIINGGQITEPPRKVILISEPGVGRVWRPLGLDEAKTHATEMLKDL